VRELVEAMLSRRSTARLVGPGPDGDELDLLLRAATTVPDHGNLRPYRFVVVPEGGQHAFGDALAAAVAEAHPDAPGDKLAKARSKAFLAPCRVVIVSSPRGDRIPLWEQEITAGCTGYALALAAHALGLGAIWKTAGVLDGTDLRRVLGLEEGERILGWVNVGRLDPATTPVAPTGADGTEAARPPVDLGAIASVLDHTGRTPYPGGS
jgi:nitroreductase